MDNSTIDRLKGGFIHKGDDNDFLFFEINFGKGISFSQKINEKRVRLLESEVTSRTLNYWEEKNLLPVLRDNNKGWRKYSIIDLVWINIIVELRKFGLQLDQIKKIKDDIFTQEDNNTNNFIAPELNLYVASCFLNKPSYLIVFANGNASLGTFQEINFSIQLGFVKNHISISLNDIVSKIIPSKEGKLKPDFSSLFELKKEEIDLLFELRFKEWDEITLKSKDNKIATIETTTIEESKERISDLLSKSDYQDIIIKRRDKNIVSIKRTELKRIRKK